MRVPQTWSPVALTSTPDPCGPAVGEVTFVTGAIPTRQNADTIRPACHEVAIVTTAVTEHSAAHAQTFTGDEITLVTLAVEQPQHAYAIGAAVMHGAHIVSVVEKMQARRRLGAVGIQAHRRTLDTPARHIPKPHLTGRGSKYPKTTWFTVQESAVIKSAVGIALITKAVLLPSLEHAVVNEARALL